jgi:hypothetical protein
MQNPDDAKLTTGRNEDIGVDSKREGQSWKEKSLNKRGQSQPVISFFIFDFGRI